MARRRRSTQREQILFLLADGRPVRRIDLVRKGFSQGVISRMLACGEIETAGSAGVRARGAADVSEEATLAAIAAVFGPKGGVLTCHTALTLDHYGLVDTSDTQSPSAILLPFPAHKGNGDLRVQTFRTRRREALTVGVETRLFLGYPLKVANVSRALCDMFAPWARGDRGVVAEGDATSVLVRVATIANGEAIINQAWKYGQDLGWGGAIADLYQTVKVARSYDLEQMGHA
jgi:hypothetical protein